MGHVCINLLVGWLVGRLVSWLTDSETRTDSDAVLVHRIALVDGLRFRVFVSLGRKKRR